GSRPGDLESFFDIELHWNRFSPRATLQTQKHWLEVFSGKNITINRTHFLLWGKNYTRPFRLMEASGLQMDSSYGPNRGRGYLFCTALPFHPLDQRGLPFKINELPFQVQENWGDATPEFVEKLIRENAKKYHLALVTLYHPHKLMKKEEFRKKYSEQVEKARELGLWVTSMKEFKNFWDERQVADIKSSYKHGILEIDVDGLNGGLTLAVPAVEMARTYSDGKPVNVFEVENAGEKMLLITIPGGRHKIKVTYHGDQIHP
ncbi:MAG: hypothetical protein J7M18_08155, partial [Candidatus Eremiobacteraeota bacterium]|nr:hypothetical protein [Candidatus Eremiobacteraeota bacterium]